jgi:hypothetical protein
MNSKKQDVNHRLAKFFARATYNEQCLEYYAEKYNNYIHLKHAPEQYFKTNSTSLHRFVYAVWNDTALTTDDVIMHTCDNRICINPRHLKLGTIQTNNADRTNKARKKQNKST